MSVTMILDIGQIIIKVPVQVVELGSDFSPHRGVCEELQQGARVEIFHEEDPVQRQREEVRPQQAAFVDDIASGRADTSGRGEAARRESAEDASEDVVR
jgi:hypothetical protein